MTITIMQISVVLFLLLAVVVASGKDDIVVATGKGTTRPITGNNVGLRTLNTNRPVISTPSAEGEEDDKHQTSGYNPRDLLQRVLLLDPKTVTNKKENNNNSNSNKEEDDNTNGNTNNLRNNKNQEQVDKVGTATTTPIASWPPPWMLRGIADAQKRLVVVAANAGYVDFADNYAQSLERLGVTNYVFVPLDLAAYKTLKKAYPGHTLPLFPGISKEENEEQKQKNNDGAASAFGSKAFQKITAGRPSFLRAFLEQGYTVFYNDIDMVWKQNAWNVLEEHNNNNKQHTNANHVNESYTAMLWRDGEVQLCSCLMYLTPVPSSFQILDQWATEIATDAYANDQPAFQEAIKKLEIYGHDEPSTSNPLVAVWPNDKQFPFGKQYFTDSPVEVEDWRDVVIIHNNWIVGKKQKKQRFIDHDLWHPSGLIPSV
jgi:hypothetical protein